MHDRDRRRAEIRALLLGEEIRSQEQLLTKLEQRGLGVSQPVLSRDLRSLGVVKRNGVYQLLETERVTPLDDLRELLRAVEPASHFVLIICEPGAASAVARALEAEKIDGLAGTIAGDDTVLVALQSRSAALSVRRRVQQLL
ncbi:MAG: hypothetical protein AB1486_07450 [Planctomycetota bacterium]